jgi:hypothetical protein
MDRLAIKTDQNGEIGVVSPLLHLLPVGGHSIDNQKLRIKQYCALHDHELIDEIVEKGVSGKISKREVYIKPMQIVENIECDGIIAYLKVLIHPPPMAVSFYLPSPLTMKFFPTGSTAKFCWKCLLFKSIVPMELSLSRHCTGKHENNQ